MYDAFLTYSRKDSAFAAWLEKKLERYRAPSGLSIKQRRLNVFRDVQDIVGNQLSSSIETAIEQSRRLVVVCSPRARDSEWVAKEINAFVAHHGASGIVPVLLDGRPNNEVRPDDPRQDQAFPDALLDHLDEPLAADFRSPPGERLLESRERRREAQFQLLASLFGTEKNALLRRHLQRRRQLQALALTASLALTVVFAWLAYSAERSAEEARLQTAVAEEQRGIAEREREIAVARQLGAQSQMLLDQHSELLPRSVLLAVESMRRYPSRLADQALRRGQRLLARQVFRTEHQCCWLPSFSADGRFMATLSADATVDVFETESNRKVKQIKLPEPADRIALGPTASYLIAIIKNEAEAPSDALEWWFSPNQEPRTYNVGIWDVATGRPRTNLESLSGVALSDDAQRIATTAVTGKRCSPSPSDPVPTDKPSTEPQLLLPATVLDTKRCRHLVVRDAATGSKIRELDYESPQDQVSFGQGGQRLLINLYQDGLRILDLSDDEEVAVQPYHGRGMPVMTPDGNALVFGTDKDYKVIKRDLRSGQELVLGQHDDTVHHVALTPDGSLTVSGGHDGIAHVWNTAVGGEVARVVHDYPVEFIAMSADGQRVASWGCKPKPQKIPSAPKDGQLE